MTKLAAIYFYKELEKRNLTNIAWIVNLVHDEANIECKKEYSKEVSEIITKAMLDAGKVFCKVIPMIAEPNICQSWSK